MNRETDVIRIQSGEGSKFNSALADLERIHQLLQMAHAACIRGDMVTWCRSLNCLYRELRPYLNDAERDDIEEERITSVPPRAVGRAGAEAKLDSFEQKLRYYRAKKKLGIVADEDAGSAALR